MAPNLPLFMAPSLTLGALLYVSTSTGSNLGRFGPPMVRPGTDIVELCVRTRGSRLLVLARVGFDEHPSPMAPVLKMMSV